MCSWILVCRRAIETTVRLYCIAAVYWNVYKCRGPEEGGAPLPPRGRGDRPPTPEVFVRTPTLLLMFLLF